jgi:hypothetical protein
MSANMASFRCNRDRKLFESFLFDENVPLSSKMGSKVVKSAPNICSFSKICSGTLVTTDWDDGWREEEVEEVLEDGEEEEVIKEFLTGSEEEEEKEDLEEEADGDKEILADCFE